MRYVIVNTNAVVESVVVWDGKSEWAPPDKCLALQSDTANIGWIYSNGAFSAPEQEVIPLTDEQLATEARAKRDMLIAESDYLLMPDYPITAEKLTLVKTYRQLLRDITKQLGFPATLDWPQHPMI